MVTFKKGDRVIGIKPYDGGSWMVGKKGEVIYTENYGSHFSMTVYFKDNNGWGHDGRIHNYNGDSKGQWHYSGKKIHEYLRKIVEATSIKEYIERLVEG